MTARLKREIQDLTLVVGLDVSETAIEKAQIMFPEIKFYVGTHFY